MYPDDLDHAVGREQEAEELTRLLATPAVVPGMAGDSFIFTFVGDFSPDGRFLAYSAGQSGNSDVHIWDLRAGKEHATCRGHTLACYALRFSPDSSLLATGDCGGDLYL